MENFKQKINEGAAKLTAKFSKEEKPEGEHKESLPPNADKCAAERAFALHKAMEGMSTDEHAFVEVLAPVKPAEMLLLRSAYKEHTKRELEDDIDTKLSGDMRKVFLEFIKTPERFDADLLHKAFQGMGTDDELLIEVLCTRDDAAIRAAADEYRRVYEVNMRDAVAEHTKGSFREALLKIIDAALGDGRLAPSDDEVPELAKRIFKAGEDKSSSTNKSVFIDVCAGYTREFVMKVSAYYARNYKGHSLEHVIKKKLGGDLEKCLLALTTPNDEFFAEKLHAVVKRVRAHSTVVTRVVVGQRLFLKEISVFYLKKFEKDLAIDVREDVGGDSGDALAAIVKAHGQQL